MQIRSPLFPQIGYGGEGQRQRIDRTIGPISFNNPQNSFQAAFSASWELDLWGRVRRLAESARADLLATEEARRGVILSLVSSTAATYIQLLGLDDQLAISKRSMAAYGESVELFEKQHAYGQVSLMNVEQARTQYETAAAKVPQIELAIVQTENALSLLLGRNPGSIARGRTMQEIAMPDVPAGIPSDILANRPDIRQAEQSLVALNAQIGAATALYFPTISLTGTLGYASGSFRTCSKAVPVSGAIPGR